MQRVHPAVKSGISCRILCIAQIRGGGQFIAIMKNGARDVHPAEQFHSQMIRNFPVFSPVPVRQTDTHATDGKPLLALPEMAGAAVTDNRVVETATTQESAIATRRYHIRLCLRTEAQAHAGHVEIYFVLHTATRHHSTTFMLSISLQQN